MAKFVFSGFFEKQILYYGCQQKSFQWTFSYSLSYIIGFAFCTKSIAKICANKIFEFNHNAYFTNPKRLLIRNIKVDRNPLKDLHFLKNYKKNYKNKFKISFLIKFFLHFSTKLFVFNNHKYLYDSYYFFFKNLGLTISFIWEK